MEGTALFYRAIGQGRLADSILENKDAMLAFKDSANDTANEFIQNVAPSIEAGLQEGRDQIGALKDSLLGLKDTTLEIKVKAEREGIGAVKADIEELSSVEAIDLALSIDPKSEDVTQRRIRNLAVDQLVEVVVGLDKDEAEGCWTSSSKKPRQARIIAEALTANAEGTLKDAAANRVVRLLAEGKVAAAEKVLNDTARGRDTSVTARALIGQAEGSLNNTARTRTSTVNAVLGTDNVQSVLNARSYFVRVNAVVSGAPPGAAVRQNSLAPGAAVASAGPTINRIYIDGRSFDASVASRFSAYESERAVSYMMAGV